MPSCRIIALLHQSGSYCLEAAVHQAQAGLSQTEDSRHASSADCCQVHPTWHIPTMIGLQERPSVQGNCYLWPEAAAIALRAEPCLNHSNCPSLRVWLTGKLYVDPSGRLPSSVKGLPGANSLMPFMDSLSNGPICSKHVQRLKISSHCGSKHECLGPHELDSPCHSQLGWQTSVAASPASSNLFHGFEQSS